MQAQEFMVKNVITVSASKASAQDAAKIMNDKGIGCLVAVDADHVAGIVTERDLLKRVIEACKNPRETQVSEIMTSNIIVGDPKMELVEASRLMFENKIKKLPIVENDQLVGLITLTDVARATCINEETMKLIEALQNMHKSGQSPYHTSVTSLNARK
jgi:CBS domain-containing protein